MGCLPPAGPDCQFVACMEDVLDVYHRPHDPKRPQVNLDETSKQLVGEVRPPLPPAPGQAERYDCEYVRNGSGGQAGRLHLRRSIWIGGPRWRFWCPVAEGSPTARSPRTAFPRRQVHGPSKMQSP